MEIERQSEATLRIQREEDMDPGKKERFIEFQGNSRARQRALKLVMQSATFVRDDNGKVLKDGQSEVSGAAEVVQIRCDEVGRILGRGGENIRRIEDASGARLELDRSEGRIQIRGPADAVAKARSMLLAEVSAGRSLDGGPAKDESRAEPQKSSASAQSPLQIWVHSREAGRIIGRGGETVREVMQRSGADVQVQRSDGSEHAQAERSIQIIGNKQQQEEAFAMISTDLTYVRGEHGTIKSPDMKPHEVAEAVRVLFGGQPAPPMNMMGGCPMGGPPAGMVPQHPMGMMGMPPGMPPPGMHPGGPPGMPGGPPMPYGMPGQGMPGGMPGGMMPGAMNGFHSPPMDAMSPGDPMWSGGARERSCSRSRSAGRDRRRGSPNPEPDSRWKAIDWDEL